MKTFTYLLYASISLLLAYDSIFLTNVFTRRETGTGCNALDNNCSEYFACGDGRCYVTIAGSYLPMDVGKTCVNDPSPDCYEKTCSVFVSLSHSCTLLDHVNHNGTKSCAGD